MDLDTIENKPRLLTNFEIAAFLARHPLTAARVTATKAAILIGAYDFDIYTTDAESWGILVVKFPGIIEPRGIQAEDSVFGLVTIQPAPSGMYFSGFSPAIGDIDKPDYDPQPFPGPLDDLKSALTVAMLVGGVFLLSKSK